MFRIDSMPFGSGSDFSLKSRFLATQKKKEEKRKRGEEGKGETRRKSDPEPNEVMPMLPLMTLRSEKDLRNWLRKIWPGWLDWREPRGSMGVGAPDCMVCVGGQITPIELKVARDGKVEIRPAQRAWHTRLSAAGGASFFLIGFSGQGVWLLPAKAALDRLEWASLSRDKKNQVVDAVGIAAIIRKS